MRTFAFRHTWVLPADVATTYAALADVEAYPLWWPQVRRADRVDEDSGRACVRSLLPWTLDLLLTREVEDPVGRVLRARISGDLRGWSQWRLEPDDGGTLAHYAQEATVTSSAVAPFAPLVGPVLRANHAWMMRCGELGLRVHLANG